MQETSSAKGNPDVFFSNRTYILFIPWMSRQHAAGLWINPFSTFRFIVNPQKLRNPYLFPLFLLGPQCLPYFNPRLMVRWFHDRVNRAQDVVSTAQQHSVRRLLVDLSGNPGGFVDLAYLFVRALHPLLQRRGQRWPGRTGKRSLL